MRTLGVYLAELLEAYGVDTVFGIPGVHTVELYRGLPLTRIRHVTPRHEQGAGFMADGYARVTGKTGVCLLITGPGLTNAATAMAQAYADSIPMLVITGVNAVGRMGSGRGWLHELKDQQAFAEQISASSTTILTREDLDDAVAHAFALFATERPRPVHIEIPTNIMRLEIDTAIKPVRRPLPSPRAPEFDRIAEAASLLSNAKTPLLLVGGGAINAAQSIRTLAERLDAPVVMTVNGRGILPSDHPLALPFNPSLRPLRDAMTEADVTLAIGTEFGPTDYDWYEDGGFQIPGTLIRIDLDEAQAERGIEASLKVIADARLSVEALCDHVTQSGSSSGAARAAEARRRVDLEEVTPIYRAGIALLDCVKETLPHAIIAGDSTQPTYAGSVGYAPDAPRRFFGSMTGFGTLGYALPAAIGARVGVDHPVVAVIGDGGLQFTIAELGSAVEERVPVIILVWNNQGYGEIKSFMIAREIQPQGVDIGAPDLCAIARGYGMHAERLEAFKDLPRLLREASARQGPTLIDIDEARLMANL
jgi:acetolactate synthase-1/2/3 large subunit